MSCNTDLLATLGLPSLPSTSPDTVAGLVWAREALQKHTAITYGVQDPKGIDELKAVNIGINGCISAAEIVITRFYFTCMVGLVFQ